MNEMNEWLEGLALLCFSLVVSLVVAAAVIAMLAYAVKWVIS